MFASSSQKFLSTSLMNMTFLTLSEMVGFTSKSTMVYMTFPSRESLLTGSSKNAYPRMATTNAPPLPDYHATNGALSSSALPSTTLVLNIPVTAMPITFDIPSKSTITSLKTTGGIYTLASISNENIPIAHVALPWITILPTSALSGITPAPRSISFPPTSTHPFIMLPKSNTPRIPLSVLH